MATANTKVTYEHLTLLVAMLMNSHNTLGLVLTTWLWREHIAYDVTNQYFERVGH